jgi:hypothetical protein
MKRVLVVFPAEDFSSLHIDTYRGVRERIIKWINIFYDKEKYLIDTLLEDENSNSFLSELGVDFNCKTILSKDEYDFLSRQEFILSPFNERFLSKYHSTEFIELVNNTKKSLIKTRDVNEYIERRKKRIITSTEKSFKELYKKYDIVLQFVGSRKLFPYISSISSYGDEVISIVQNIYNDDIDIKYSGVDLSFENTIKILRGE